MHKLVFKIITCEMHAGPVYDSCFFEGPLYHSSTKVPSVPSRGWVKTNEISHIQEIVVATLADRRLTIEESNFPKFQYPQPSWCRYRGYSKLLAPQERILGSTAEN